MVPDLGSLLSPSHPHSQTIITIITVCPKSLSNRTTSPLLHGHAPGQATILSHINRGSCRLSTLPLYSTINCQPANRLFSTHSQRDPDRTQVTACPSSAYKFPWLSTHSGKIQTPPCGPGPAQHSRLMATVVPQHLPAPTSDSSQMKQSCSLFRPGLCPESCLILFSISGTCTVCARGTWLLND